MTTLSNALQIEIDSAKLNREQEIEVDGDVLDYVMRGKHWRDAGYVWIRDVKCYGSGLKEDSLSRDNKQISQILHGDTSVNEGRT